MKTRYRLMFAAMMWTLIAVGTATGVHAQEQPPRRVTQVFELEHVQPSELQETLELFEALINANDELGTLTVSAYPESMTAIEDVIARLDVVREARAIEVTAYILTAGGDIAGRPVPLQLGNVVEQLENAFGYDGFQMIDTIVVRGFDGGRPSVEGVISLPALGGVADQPTFYNFSGEFRVVDRDDTSALRIERMRAGFRVPVRSGTAAPEGLSTVVNFSYVNVGINTDVEIPERSQVVVGKATVADSPWFLVMTAEFLN